MREYHKINGIFKRDESGKFIHGDYSVPEFEYLANAQWTFTEKVDGTNIRMGWNIEEENGGNWCIRGRTDKAVIPEHLLTALQALDLESKLSRLVTTNNVCLYGEGYGPKIQAGNGYDTIVSSPRFVLFDIRIGHMWLKREDMEGLAGQLGLSVVPEVGTGTIAEGIEMVTGGMRSAWGDFNAEGVIAVPSTALLDRRGHRIITKLKTKDFE